MKIPIDGDCYCSYHDLVAYSTYDIVDPTAPNCKTMSSLDTRKTPRPCDPTKVCAVCRETLPCREVGQHLRSPGHFRPGSRPEAYMGVHMFLGEFVTKQNN
jgi:hypothetical protein